MNYSITYAQNHEDLILAGFLKSVKNGFYVDVGANDPDVYSVTKRFYMSGWHGINIEPSSRFFNRLELKRTRDVNLMVGVGSSNKDESFREYLQADGWSTFSDVMKQSYEQTGHAHTLEYTDTIASIRTLKSIFEEFAVDHIDFLKIDIEGYEYDAIVGNDWNKYRPTLLCIEANHIDKDWRPKLLEYNYVLAFFDGLNEYYVAKESESLVKDFSYPEAVLGQDYISLEIYQTLQAYKNEIRKLNDTMFIDHKSYVASQEYSINLEQQIRDAQQGMKELEYYTWQSRRLKNSLKMFIRALDVTLRANIVRFENRFLMKTVKATQVEPEVLIALSKNKNKLLSSIQSYDYKTNLHYDDSKKLINDNRRYIVDIEHIYLKATRSIVGRIRL